ncbi:MAG: hypothetical protein U9N79_11495 [Actinomycetota bacterium]|nr:hypothetical protein [Actinomycetota bacterium]
MATEKVSVSLDHQMVTAARERVGGRGLSGYVNDALRRQLQRDRIQDLLAELDDEFGPIPDHVMEEVRDLWPEPDGHTRQSA